MSFIQNLLIENSNSPETLETIHRIFTETVDELEMEGLQYAELNPDGTIDLGFSQDAIDENELAGCEQIFYEAFGYQFREAIKEALPKLF